MTVEAADHIKILNLDGRTIYLVGTAHVSDKSVEEVQTVIDEVKPDTVCVELCDTRYQALTDEDRWRRLNIFDVIREGKTLLLLANLALSAYQRRLGAKLGVDPGAELLAGAKKAQEVGAKLELIDRNIQTTLKRTWSNVGFFQKVRLLSMIVGSTFSREEIDAETIEELKGQAQLSEMLSEFASYMPEVKEPLIDERDRYMMSKIRESEGDCVVAVVGAAHSHEGESQEEPTSARVQILHIKESSEFECRVDRRWHSECQRLGRRNSASDRIPHRSSLHPELSTTGFCSLSRRQPLECALW